MNVNENCPSCEHGCGCPRGVPCRYDCICDKEETTPSLEQMKEVEQSTKAPDYVVGVDHSDTVDATVFAFRVTQEAKKQKENLATSGAKQATFLAKQRGQHIRRLERYIRKLRDKLKSLHRANRMSQADRIKYELEKEFRKKQQTNLFHRTAEEAIAQKQRMRALFNEAVTDNRPWDVYFYGGAEEALRWITNNFADEPLQEYPCSTMSAHGERHIAAHKWIRSEYMKAIRFGFYFGLGGSLLGVFAVELWKVLWP